VDSDLITAALSLLTGVRCRISEGTLDIRVPDVDDGFVIPVENIQWIHRTSSPTGGPAAALELRGYNIRQPLIVTDEDIVFPPVDPNSLLDTTVRFRMSNVPPLVAYSEMERDAERIAEVCTDLRGKNLESVAASVLMIRCFIVGAMRFGAWPINTAAWWHRAWLLAGDQLYLPFLSDPTWDALASDAASVVLCSTREELDERLLN
jgi:hypothetical protein